MLSSASVADTAITFGSAAGYCGGDFGPKLPAAATSTTPSALAAASWRASPGSAGPAKLMLMTRAPWPVACSMPLMMAKVVASALLPGGAERADRQDARGRRHAHQPRARRDRAGDRGAVRVRLLRPCRARRTCRRPRPAARDGRRRRRNRSPRPGCCCRWRGCAPRSAAAWPARIAPDRRPRAGRRPPPRPAWRSASRRRRRERRAARACWSAV